VRVSMVVSFLQKVILLNECRQLYQISHPYPGSSWPFSLLHPLPLAEGANCLSKLSSTQNNLTIKNKLTKIPKGKKDTVEWPTCCVTHGVYYYWGKES
jgi:hypothetical protein